MEPAEQTATDDGDSELMDSKTQALLDAIRKAGDCRRNDPMERICHVCWDAVSVAAEAVDPTKTDVKFV